MSARKRDKRVPLERVFDHVTQAELARRLGVSAQAIVQWRQRGQCPAKRAVQIANAINRKVTPFELRPDLYGV